MPRLVANSLRERAAGRYDLTPGGIAVPRSNFAELRIRRPNTQRGERAWTNRGPGGVAQTHRENNGDKEAGYSGLDTEVVRAYLFLSEDAGSSWIPYGHVGAEGGDKFDRRGDLMTETSLRIELPREDNPERRLQVVLRCNEALRTQVFLDVNSNQRPGTSQATHHSLALEDSVGAGASTATSVSSASITPAGDRRFLVVFGGNEDGAPSAYSSITYDGNTLTQLFTDVWTYYRVSCATEVAPDTGGGVCAYTTTGNEEGICVAGLAFSDVDQTTPTDTAPAAVTGGTNPSMTITAGDSGDWRVAAVSGDGNYTVGANETSRVEVESIGTYSTSLVVSTKDDGGSDAMNWSGGTFGYIMRGFNINEDTGGGTTVTGSGTPAAQASDADGTAEREVTGSGTPASQASTAAGSGTVGSAVTGTGVPQAQAATVAGTAERQITGTGAAAAQAATVAGTGERGIQDVGSPPEIDSQSAQVAGVGEITKTGSGAPQSQSSTTSGTAEREITGSGAPSAQAAQAAGTGTVGGAVTGTGAPAAQSAQASGTAEREVTGSGVAAALAATAAGTGSVGGIFVGSGSPAAQSSQASGTAQREVVGTGSTASQSADVDGSGALSGTIAGSGSVAAQSAEAAGSAVRTITGSGSVAAQSPTVAGSDFRHVPDIVLKAAKETSTLTASRDTNILRPVR